MAAPEQEAPPAPPLPILRQDLRILEGPLSQDGDKSWLIQDLISHKYHALGTRGFLLLSQWQAVPAPDFLEIINQHASPKFDQQDIEEMCEFLYAQKLTIIPPGLDTDKLAEQEDAANPTFMSQILHKYIFFRIPIFRPQRFLNAAYPYIAPLYSRAFSVVIMVLGLIGFWFALEQWDVFKSTFLHFLTFEGLIYYGLTLLVLKAIHELGHAFMATRFGTKVPIIGVAFLLMFPILYTDTTDAHRLKNRREKVLIDGAGMLAELCIACLALFAWSFLPDGTLRSVAFFTATTSWGLSLMVNLNPFMRFDGYYLASDLFGQRNLQDRSFALGRWYMRETLFGLGDKIPVIGTRRERFWLILYAYGTWIYRFFLFIGIAILVHALFPKAIGIFLFVIEILFFIVKPIFSELLIWWRLRMDILKTRRFITTCAAILALCGILFLPWQQTVNAPALLRPAVQTELYTQNAGKVEQVFVANGDVLKRGQLIAVLTSEDLAHNKAKSQMRIHLLRAQLARRAADLQDRRAGDVLARALKKEQATLSGIEALQANLQIRAPHDGRLVELNPNLHTGRYINPDFKIAHLIDTSEMEILSFVSDTQLARIKPGAPLTFIADDLLASPNKALKAHVNFIAPTGEEFLNEPVFSSDYSGPIAVKPPQEGRSKPVTSITRIKARPQTAHHTSRALRGVVQITASSQSPAKAIWRRIKQVLIRETDF